MEQPGGPPLRVDLETLLSDTDAGPKATGDDSSDDDDNSTATSTSQSTRTQSTGTSTNEVSTTGDDYTTSSRLSSTSSSSSDAGFGAGAGDDEWKPGALLAGFGSASLTHCQCPIGLRCTNLLAVLRGLRFDHFLYYFAAEPVIDLEKASKRGGTKAIRRSNNAFEEKIRQTHRSAGNQNW